MTAAPPAGAGERRRSLRVHLIGWLTIPLCVVGIFLAWLAYTNAELTAGLVTDRILSASAHGIAEQIKVDDGVVEALIPPSALGIFATGAGDRVVYKVLDHHGELIAGLPDVPDAPASLAETDQVYYEAQFRRQPVRVVAITQPLAGIRPDRDGRGGEATVIVAVTTRDRDAMIRALWLHGVQPMAVTLLLVAALGWFGLDRALKPLDALRIAVAERSASHLSPLPMATVPTEVRPLVVAFNDALARLDRYIEAQRRFIANAAHQMRTPLTLLKMQTHFGLTEESGAAKTEALKALDQGLDALVRLLGQLLVLARAEPRTPTRPDVKPVDMVELVQGVLIDLGPLALDRPIDLGFETGLADDDRPLVKASPTLLREMLINLVDNAIRYTPAGGSVMVAVDRDTATPEGGWLSIAVRDSGPGIPLEERDRVFERFYRVLGTGIDGNGLGLAIVKEIVTGTGGEVTLSDGPQGRGLSVLVRLPLTETA